ncbi:unnamed protein product [Coffea canephora]|uniref:Uncharacterized protein n=1 Tax=Coffea canephora TaxID=49390 RepID=A0A068UKW8_COFCA|nr:unnamed protein product [Coffea canephora]
MSLLRRYNLMSQTNSTELIRSQQNVAQFSNGVAKKLYKLVVISGLVLYIMYNLWPGFHCCYSFSVLTHLRPTVVGNLESSYSSGTGTNSATSISHIVFGIASTSNSWRNKRWFIESWWRPNVTRGFVFLDTFPVDLIPWPASSPPFRISENTSRYKDYDKHEMTHAIRLARIIREIINEEDQNDEDVRWYVIADDDTVIFINNLVEVLSRYDYNKYFYVGMNSECHASNYFHSFEMAFGGAGYALSYPLARALAKNLDVCIRRYPSLYGSDHIVQSCVADLGVSLTQEKGFHQIDLHSDISGLLSAHPQSPLVSLHHLKVVDPIFPSMTRNQSLNHLMKAANADESRLLQQTICYHKQNNWSFSISWGYSAQVYEAIYPPSILRLPLQTFRPWMFAKPFYILNTRIPSTKDPCQIPHVFFFYSVETITDIIGRQHLIATTYTRRRPRFLPACSSTGNHSAAHINMIRVLSPVLEMHDGVGRRRECCEVEYESRSNTTKVQIRACVEDEIIP